MEEDQEDAGNISDFARFDIWEHFKWQKSLFNKK